MFCQTLSYFVDLFDFAMPSDSDGLLQAIPVLASLARLSSTHLFFLQTCCQGSVWLSSSSSCKAVAQEYFRLQIFASIS